jgi:hypothetical protein
MRGWPGMPSDMERVKLHRAEDGPPPFSPFGIIGIP